MKVIKLEARYHYNMYFIIAITSWLPWKEHVRGRTWIFVNSNFHTPVIFYAFRSGSGRRIPTDNSITGTRNQTSIDITAVTLYSKLNASPVSVEGPLLTRWPRTELLMAPVLTRPNLAMPFYRMWQTPSRENFPDCPKLTFKRGSIHRAVFSFVCMLIVDEVVIGNVFCIYSGKTALAAVFSKLIICITSSVEILKNNCFLENSDSPCCFAFLFNELLKITTTSSCLFSKIQLFL